ncbi:MAG: hypothetical protein K1X35_09890 [Caulobacteraceae bacterium]|nr:hypothetical protein [Caulobacteraceae bacterium]
MSDENVTVTENTAVVRDPVTGEARRVVERTVTRTDNSNWGLWVAGIAVFGAVLVIALFLIGRGRDTTAADDAVLAAQAQAEASRIQAEQAIQDANSARIAAAASAYNTGSAAANNAAAASAAAAEAAAARADAAARAASAPAPAPTDDDAITVEKAPGE